MAKQRNIAEPDTGMKRHIFSDLGFSDINQYESWCHSNGFGSGTVKSDMQRRMEYEHRRRTLAEETLRKNRESHNPFHAIARIFTGELDEETVNDAPLKIIAQACRKQQASPELHLYLTRVDAASKLLSEKQHTVAVLNIFHFRREWVRDVSDWKPGSHNIDRQLAGLARYLFCAYQPPSFMTSVWYKKNRKLQRWYIHLGLGGSIRDAPGLPVPLTRKMAHYFLAAPEHFSPLEAIRYGQVLALGGDGRIAGAILGTRLGVDFRDDPFALELIRFFIRNPFLDKAQYAPIVDYIWNRKYENQRIFVERGVVEEREPAQPGFSMAGRTAPNLIRQMEAWHVRLGRSPKGGLLEWGRSPVPPLEMVEGKKEQRNMRVWRISELLSSRELEDEGRAQGHCVASYAVSCRRGLCSIWSLRCETENGVKRLLTVELNMKTREIVQARGKGNRFPEKKELEVLGRWAAAEGLRINEYVAGL